MVIETAKGAAAYTRQLTGQLNTETGVKTHKERDINNVGITWTIDHELTENYRVVHIMVLKAQGTPRNNTIHEACKSGKLSRLDSQPEIPAIRTTAYAYA
jgi:hypothetical protein